MRTPAEVTAAAENSRRRSAVSAAAHAFLHPFVSFRTLPAQRHSPAVRRGPQDGNHLHSANRRRDGCLSDGWPSARHTARTETSWRGSSASVYAVRGHSRTSPLSSIKRVTWQPGNRSLQRWTRGMTQRRSPRPLRRTIPICCGFIAFFYPIIAHLILFLLDRKSKTVYNCQNKRGIYEDRTNIIYH